MDWFLHKTIGFFIDNFPSWQALAIGGPLGLAWSFAALWFAGRLKQGGARTGYTRKVFHFLIFATAAVLQWRCGTPAVCLFGGMCTLVVFFAVWRGSGTVLYEALAREKDAPHRTFFILVPYFTTLAGGLASNMLFGPVAVAGYLVTGLGDAIGEPAGTLFGKHHYRVRSLSSVPATRSLEGSAAVFVMSLAALGLAAAICPQITLAHFGILKIAVIAAAATAAEAISPHGWDNATMQIVPAALVWLWMT
jgi:phytol kinase